MVRKCKKCNKGGLFLQLYQGMCRECYKNSIVEKQKITSKSEILMSEKEMVDRIISSTDFDQATSIDEMDQLSRKRSNLLYERREVRISAFDPYSVKLLSEKPAPLLSVEKYFAKKMNKQNVASPYVAGYWTYEYSLDYAKTMTKLLANGYIQISDPYQTLQMLKIPDLKEILTKHNLKISGKKDELIQRISKNVSLELLQDDLSKYPRFFLLTDRGGSVTASLPKSATFHLELEDQCLQHILNHDFSGAYTLVCENERKKIIPRGIGTDWKAAQDKGLSEFTVDLYETLWDTYIPLPDDVKPFEEQLKASVILGTMLGVSAQKSHDLFIRISKESFLKYNLIVIVDFLKSRILNAEQQHSFQALKNL